MGLPGECSDEEHNFLWQWSLRGDSPASPLSVILMLWKMLLSCEWQKSIIHMLTSPVNCARRVQTQPIFTITPPVLTITDLWTGVNEGHETASSSVAGFKKWPKGERKNLCFIVQNWIQTDFWQHYKAAFFLKDYSSHSILRATRWTFSDPN